MIFGKMSEICYFRIRLYRRLIIVSDCKLKAPERQNICKYFSLNRIVKTPNFKHIYTLVAIVAAFVAVFAAAFPSYAAASARYAASSKLASGKWSKIKVINSGMQFISNNQLKTMGFNDPSKVNVYGFGGRQISEVLNDRHPDDLPLLPIVRTNGGIIFFGVDHIDWSPRSTDKSNLIYEHTMQTYSENSYYMLSDVASEGSELPISDLRETSGLNRVSTFFERMVHEKDLFAPSNTGRVLLGEDFRSGNQQSFEFALPGNAGGNVTAYIQFGSKVTGNQAKLMLSSNGKISHNSLNIPGATSEGLFMVTSNTAVDVTGCGDKLKLNLSFTSSGVTTFARLDYIEVGYERALTVPSDQLYFYLSENEDKEVVVSGITEETQIWDVTVRHAPKKVNFNRNGNTAIFKTPKGYCEYIAFNPSKISTTAAYIGEVSNQDIHSLAVPDLLIISPAEYKHGAEKVANLHRELDGMTVHVLTPEEIYNEFSSGNPDLSAFRKVLKMWYDRGLEESGTGDSKMKYCLIFGRPTYDPKGVTDAIKNAGYRMMPIWQSITGTTENTSYSTDDYIGMLDDNTSGTLTIGSEKIRVAVGRFPVRSAAEADLAATKLEEYLKNTSKTNWRNNVLIVADDQDDAKHLLQAETMFGNMTQTDKGNSFQYERLYLDNFVLTQTSVGPQYPEAKSRLLSKIEEGQAFFAYIGHANTVSWTHEKLLTWKEITSFTNEKWPVLYAATCEFARWDDPTYSGAEVMWAYPKAGIIATICPSRSVFISSNGPLSAQFGKSVFDTSGGKTLGDVYRNSKNGLPGHEDNKLRYTLIGDPAMRMPIPENNVKVNTIKGVTLEEGIEELPVIEARSTPMITGVITDSEGNILEDFSGHLYIKLYDSEKVVTTNGNGPDGKVVEYNDRKTKLYEGITKIKNGQWEVKINMPSEIEENYTTGRMTYYAVSDDGREANGATEQFYVYGYDNNAPEDNEGPVITQFTLNSENFENGGITHTTPVVFATFNDESGINVSETGIGHQLSLTLDGKTVYNDVTDFYIPDPDDNRAGSIVYQLPEITPGKHELRLSVWDNANNSSYATLAFNVAVNKKPEIHNITAVYSSDYSGVDFIVSSDRPLSMLNCKVEIFDISGIKIWSNIADEKTSSSSSLTMHWNYTTASGQRLNKGIYVCRVTVESPEGGVTSKSKKIVVPAV